MTAPNPAPYPTEGSAQPNAWQCDTITEGDPPVEYERCVVTSWQQENVEVVPAPSPTATAEPTTEPTVESAGITDQVSYGNWSNDYTEWLVGISFAAAGIILLVALYFVWARKAIKGD